VSGAVLEAPTHPGNQAEGLAQVGNDDRYEAPCTDQLKEGCQTFSSRELKRGTLSGTSTAQQLLRRVR
jgi:hypothetical protein